MPTKNISSQELETNCKNFGNNVARSTMHDDVTPVDNCSSGVSLLSVNTVSKTSIVEGNAESYSNYESTLDDLTSETYTGSSSGSCESSAAEKHSKNNIHVKEQLDHEKIPGVDSRYVQLSKDDEQCIKDVTTENNMEQAVKVVTTENHLDERADISRGNTSLVSDVCQDDDCGSVESAVTRDDSILHADVACENRTFSEGTSSSVPLSIPQETSSLFFSPDHFANVALGEQPLGDSNSSVFEAEESNPQLVTISENNGTNGQPDGRQQPLRQFIPVAQDAVTEASLPLRDTWNIGETPEPFQIGYSPPQWIPDTDVNRCMNCQCKFTMVRRRHHCRGCGKVQYIMF